jgi:ABC-type branched-subunit amino acid transport system substrate-binding protein
VSRVYASLPLTGPTAGAGRDVLRGAQLALEGATNGTAPELVVLDVFGADRDGQAMANARRAAQDEQALAYVGDFHSSQVVSSAPILGGAGLLQVAPVATYAGLHGDTLVRLTPHDGVGARAIAAWLAEHGVGLWDALHAAKPDLWLLGSDGVAQEWFAREMSPAAAQRTRFFVAARVPMGFYGYEAMALALDAIAAGEGDRAATARAARATRDRDSVLGRYSVDAEGHTTSTAYGRLAVVDGALVWDV